MIPSKAIASVLGLAIGCLALTQACAEDPTLTRQGGPEVPPQGDGGASTVPMAMGGESMGGSASEGTAFCAAFAVIRAKCQRCHGDPLQNGAPAPFLTYEDTQAAYYGSAKKWSDVMYGAVMREFMPYVALNDPPVSVMPPVEPLTDDEKATLLGWLEQGALPVGGTDCP